MWYLKCGERGEHSEGVRENVIVKNDPHPPSPHPRFYNYIPVIKILPCNPPISPVTFVGTTLGESLAEPKNMIDFRGHYSTWMMEFWKLQ